MRTGATERARLAEIEELYRSRYRSFLRFALALLGERELAHDAVQETFARAVRSRSGFRGEGSLEGWLYRTLTNCCRDEQRSARRSLAHGAPEGASASGNGHVGDDGELRAAVAALPERQKLILFLRHYADLDYARIAEVVDVRRGTVAATLHAAHATLRKTLKERTR
jgi:DNA-directed RNA polymerase specialized sigma24 family protein